MALTDSMQALTNDALRDLARNDGAPKETRLAAVEILQVRRSRHLRHPELASLVREQWLADHPEALPSAPEPPKPQAPDQMTEEETAQVIAEIVANTPPVESPDFGQTGGPNQAVSAGPFSAGVTTSGLMTTEIVPTAAEPGKKVVFDLADAKRKKARK